MNKIVKVVALRDGLLYVEFSDGRVGEFDTTPFLTSDFFSVLKNPTYFLQVGLFFSGVGWPDGQDLSPDTIASALVTHETLA